MPRPSVTLLTLTAAKRTISRWDLEQQRRLLRWLRQVVEEADAEIEANWNPTEGKNAISQERRGKSVFVLQGVKCGKEGCKCNDGDLHGPYWYEYFREDGKVVSRYHGKKIKEPASR